MMKQNFTLLFSLLLLGSLAAQDRSCHTMEHLAIQLDEYPAMQQNMEQIEQFTRQFVQSQERVNATYTIPVVVNVVWKTNSQNISDAQIMSQLAVLNDDFRRTNNDANNTWPQGADTDIEFCLATVDPSGNPTSGIRRKKTNKSSFSYNNDGVKKNNLGGLSPWPADQYLNIWVCNLGSGLLGYAQFPGGNPATDGVVCDYAYFGTIGTATAPFDEGRTATHEVGHYLNLRHIWGDGGCSVDDFVGDTPASDGPNYGCATGHVSCGSVDMVENYMDYSDDACMNLFTAGQRDRMQAVLAPGGARASLISSGGCNGGGGGPTCSDGVQNGNETGVDCGGPDCDPCQTASCDDPTGLSSTPRRKGKSARLNWNAVAGASSYTIEIRQIAPSVSGWSTATTGGTNYTANNLTAGNTYQWQVRANCSSGDSNFTLANFVAGQSGRLAADAYQLYPNPANQSLFVEYVAETTGELYLAADSRGGQVHLTVMNTQGQVLLQSQQIETNGLLELQVGHLAPGLYWLRIMDQDSDQYVTKKFIIER